MYFSGLIRTGSFFFLSKPSLLLSSSRGYYAQRPSGQAVVPAVAPSPGLWASYNEDPRFVVSEFGEGRQTIMNKHILRRKSAVLWPVGAPHKLSPRTHTWYVLRLHALIKYHIFTPTPQDAARIHTTIAKYPWLLQRT